VLVIDDDPGIVSLLQRIITKRGYQALIAHNGKEGLALTQQYHPDLIFTDIKMPDMNGDELTVLLKSNPDFATVPIVILSGTAYLVDLATTQADAILNKPFELKAVYSLLDHFLAVGQDIGYKAEELENPSGAIAEEYPSAL